MSAAVVLIDGEHHPAAVRDALERVAAEHTVAGVVFCGGEEKVRPEVLERPLEHYGFPVETGGAEAALARLAPSADLVLDLSDEPVTNAPRRLGLAARALHLGLAFQAPGLRLEVPRYERFEFDGPRLAVISTAKRSGKTAVAGHWASLLDASGARPVVVCMGRGGPAEPVLADPGTDLAALERLAAAGTHAASDYLEDAALAGVPTVGCRRVGGGLAGEPFESNVAAGAALAASREPGSIVFEGSGACIPPVEVDRTLCVVRDVAATLGELGPYRLMRSQLVLLLAGDADAERRIAELAGGPVVRIDLRPEAVTPPPDGARVALFSTGHALPKGLEPVVHSPNLSRRSLLALDLERAESERCDLYLTELKAASIEMVAARARERGVPVGFVRNRPVGLGCDLDDELVKLYEDARDDRR